MTNNKYIGTKYGLIGPVTIEIIRDFMLNQGWTFCEHGWHDGNERVPKYFPESYIVSIYASVVSLTPIPCEGWKPEEGVVYEYGVHFVTKEDNSRVGLHGGDCARIVAVPPPTAPEDILTPEEFGAYVQDAVPDIPKRHKTPPFAPQGEIILMGPDKDKSPWPLLGYAPGNYSNRCAECKKEMMGVDKLCFQCLECAARCANEIMAGKPASPQEGEKTYDPFVRKHLSRIKLGLASVGASSVFIPCMPQDEGAFNLPNTNTWLREIKFDSIEASPTYPAEFVEWMAQHTLRKGFDQYQYYKSGALFTKERLYTEWKRIKEQSKQKA